MSHKLYSSFDVVWWYRLMKNLQPPEKTVLTKLLGKLPSMKMLDIGVGGGRTTHHFSHLVKEYVGIDYSHNMVNVCVNRFKHAASHISFELGDARHLRFKDKAFDFVLFSFNGIDSVDHKDRLQILREIRRVSKRGGYFCFSSHNLQNLHRRASVRVVANPLNLVRWLSYRHEVRHATEYAHVRDGAHNFRAKIFYVSPAAQVKQLKAAGFKDIKVLSLRTGLEVPQERLHTIKDRWAYYLCRADGAPDA